MGSIFLENNPISDVTEANQHFSDKFRKLGKKFEFPKKPKKLKIYEKVIKDVKYLIFLVYGYPFF